jgi:hypothetical protein
VELIKVDAFGVEAIHVGRLEEGMAVSTDGRVALVVGENEYDVRSSWHYRISSSGAADAIMR